MMQPREAFSLVELSIVLVILGLLVGGVLSGQSLIRAAQLRAIPTEAAKYSAAIYSFKDKYFAYPGDMNNATQFWGTNAGGCPAPTGATTGSTGTCNGNGDGRMPDGDGDERFQFWQHLANASLIEGRFSGVGSASDPIYGLASGVNVPGSRLSGASWTIRYINVSAPTGAFQGNYGNMMQLGAGTSYWNDGPILKPEEVWNIDTKMDDGKPGTGRIVVYALANCAGTTNALDHTANYALSDSGVNCEVKYLPDHPLRY